MNKSNYILIFILLCLDFWDIKPYGYISPNLQLAMVFLYLCWGAHRFNDKSNFFNKNYAVPLKIIFLGILLSMVSAFVYFGQTLIQSIVAYRNQYLILSPLFIKKVFPSRQEVITGLYKFSIIYFVFAILKLVFTSLFVSEATVEYSSFEDILLQGYSLLTIPLYFTLQELEKEWDTKQAIYALFIFSLIMLNGNRSSLFPMLILSGYMFFKINTPYRAIVITIIIIFSFLFLVAPINEMIEEAQNQLNDPNYNRNKAMEYYIFNSIQNIWCAIFGNGLISSHTSDVLSVLKSMGIVNSDLGFVGYWNQFGIIPIIVFLYLYIGTLVRKRMPIYLKLISLQTLAGAFTISYFGSIHHMLFFIFFYYLYNLELSKNHSVDNNLTCYGK